jgi:integrase/recombinase XerD
MGSRHAPGHEALPIAAWPAEDRADYERAYVRGSPFEDGGAAAGWRPATHAARVGAYGRWLGHLLRHGVVLQAERGPDRLTPERVAGYVRFLRERRCAPYSVMGALGHLHAFALALWPDRDWRWLGALHARHQRLAEPTRSKEARIVPQHKLLRLGRELMLDAEALPLPPPGSVGPTHPALSFRDGLIVALLALRPLRRNNFLALAVGTTLRRESGGGWLIALPGTITKNHTPLAQQFPEVLVPALEAYLAVHRPLLAAVHGRGPAGLLPRPPGDHLWLSRWGAPLTAGGLQVLLENRTRARFGHPVNAHLFRDRAATSLAEENPDHVRIAADLLGHRSFATTQRFYIAAGQRRALRRCQAVVLERRRRARPAGPARCQNRRPDSGSPSDSDPAPVGRWAHRDADPEPEAP